MEIQPPTNLTLSWAPVPPEPPKPSTLWSRIHWALHAIFVALVGVAIWAFESGLLNDFSILPVGPVQPIPEQKKPVPAKEETEPPVELGPPPKIKEPETTTAPVPYPVLVPPEFKKSIR